MSRPTISTDRFQGVTIRWTEASGEIRFAHPWVHEPPTKATVDAFAGAGARVGRSGPGAVVHWDAELALKADTVGIWGADAPAGPVGGRFDVRLLDGAPVRWLSAWLPRRGRSWRGRPSDRPITFPELLAGIDAGALDERLATVTPVVGAWDYAPAVHDAPPVVSARWGAELDGDDERVRVLWPVMRPVDLAAALVDARSHGRVQDASIVCAVTERIGRSVTGRDA